MAVAFNTPSQFWQPEDDRRRFQKITHPRQTTYTRQRAFGSHRRLDFRAISVGLFPDCRAGLPDHRDRFVVANAQRMVEARSRRRLMHTVWLRHWL